MTLEETREYFANDLYATECCGCVIEDVREGYAKCSLKLEKKHKNARGFVMGGAYFTLADFTFAVATNTTEKATVTNVSQISYFRTPKDDTLIAETTCLKEGRTICNYQIAITDGLGNLVCTVITNGMHV